jgi:hypothetical protein
MCVQGEIGMKREYLVLLPMVLIIVTAILLTDMIIRLREGGPDVLQEA